MLSIYAILLLYIVYFIINCYFTIIINFLFESIYTNKKNKKDYQSEFFLFLISLYQLNYFLLILCINTGDPYTEVSICIFNIPIIKGGVIIKSR